MDDDAFMARIYAEVERQVDSWFAYYRALDDKEFTVQGVHHKQTCHILGGPSYVYLHLRFPASKSLPTP